MSPQELRIGNLLRDKISKTELEVVGLTKDDIVTHVIDRSKFPLPEGWSIEPIELTEEWLLKFGFDKVNNTFWVTELAVHNYNNLEFYVLYEQNRTYIKYVHQIQNLFYNLTGTELITESRY